MTPLFIEFQKNCEKFAKFYSSIEFYIKRDEEMRFVIRNYSGLTAKDITKTRRILVLCQYKKFNEQGFGDFDFDAHFNVRFEPRKYSIRDADDKILYEKSYLEQLNQKEIKRIVSSEAQRHKKFLEEKIESPKKKNIRQK